MRRPRTFFGRHRRTIFGLLFLVLFGVTVTYAVPPSSPYLPGETLDPNCAPGDSNCLVQIIPSQTGNSGKFLTTDGSSIGWASVASGGTWGTISGTLSNQTDLQNALNAKVDAVRTITINGVVQDLTANRTFTTEVPLTFSTGLTRSTNTITTNLSTGVAGGQDVVGGTAPAESLTLVSTANGTKGKILFGTSAYDEANNRLGVGTASPTVALDVTGGVKISTLTGTGNRLLQAAATGDVGASNVDPQEVTDIFSITGAQNTLISGGVVSWVTGLTFDVSAADYYIQGDRYQAPATQVTLAPADVNFDRIDVFAVDTTGSVVVIQGTPSATPTEPEIDSTKYLRLSFAYVPATAVAPQNVSAEYIYQENAEWTTSTNQPSVVDFNYATAPHTGSKSVRFSQWLSGAQATFVRSSSTTLTGTTLVFYIKTSAPWGSNSRKLSLQWLTGGTAASNSITMRDGVFGFSESNTGWQKIAIPISQWTLSSQSADRLRIAEGNNTTTSFSLQFDDIQLQGGVSNTAPAQNTFLTVQGNTGTYSAQTTKDTLRILGSNSLNTSLASNAVTVALVGDIASPGNSQYYGTNGGGSKGWYSLPTQSTPTLQQVLTAGSTLTANNTISSGTTTTEFNGSTTSSNGVLLVTNTSSSGPALKLVSSGGYGVRVETTGASSPASFVHLSSNTNSIIPVLDINAQTSGTAAAGIGTAIDMYTEVASGGSVNSTRIASVYTDVSATPTSKLEIYVQNAGTLAKRLQLAGNGQLSLSGYGSGTQTGTATYSLAVDSTGNVIEVAPGSSTKINQLQAANGTNTIDNTNYAQEWQWSTLAGTGLKLSSTSTAAAGSAQKLLELSLSGANANSSQNTYGMYVSNTHTGTGAVNYGAYYNVSGASTNYGVYGNVTSGAGLIGVATTGTGVDAFSSSGPALVAQTTSNTGVSATSATGYAGEFNVNPATPNTFDPVIRLVRNTSSTAANGIGGYISYYNEASDGSAYEAARIGSTWSDATNRAGTIDFYTNTSGGSMTQKMRLTATGQLQLNSYGVDTFSGTTAYGLAVDSSGNVIEASGLVTTVGAIGSVPNANGASISGSTLTLQPASDTYGGVVTTGAQNFKGNKNFIAGSASTSGYEFLTSGFGTIMVLSTTGNAADGYVGIGRNPEPLYDLAINQRLYVGTNLKLASYGLGNITGTAAYNLAVDSSGNVIEVAAGGSGDLQTVTTAGSSTNVGIYGINSAPVGTASNALGSLFNGAARLGIDNGTNSGYLLLKPDNANASIYARLYADNITAARTLNLPDETGILATRAWANLNNVLSSGSTLSGSYNITGGQVTFNGNGFASYLGNTSTQYSGIYNYTNHELRLDAYSTTNGDVARLTVFNSTTNDAGGYIRLAVSNSSLTQNHLLQVNHNSIELSNAFDPVNLVVDNGLAAESASQSAVCITSSGVIQQNTGAQTCTVSSERFKHDIQPLSMGALETIDQLVPSTFIYNGQTNTRIGLIAEDVNKVEPTIVFYENDGVTPRGVRYEDLAALSVKAIQELDLKVNSITDLTNDTDGSFVNQLRAWFANASNHITRIFTGEICLTDPDGSSECLSKTELTQLKQMIHSNAASVTPPAPTTDTTTTTTAPTSTTTDSTSNTTTNTQTTDTTTTQTTTTPTNSQSSNQTTTPVDSSTATTDSQSAGAVGNTAQPSSNDAPTQ